MSNNEELIDKYVTDSCVMFARLGDHLTTLDELRDSYKHTSLEQFGLKANPASYGSTLHDIVLAHLERCDVHMGTYLRYAHVVLTYMVLEDRLHAFGQLILATGRGAPFIPKKDKRKVSMLVKFDAYLSCLSVVRPSTDAVDALRLIRNCIVHCRGYLADLDEGSREKLEIYLPNLFGIALDRDDRLTLTTAGCLSLQDAAMEYIRAIDSSAGFNLWIPADVRKNFEQRIRPSMSN